jgi:hypothetical protein
MRTSGAIITAEAVNWPVAVTIGDRPARSKRRPYIGRQA